MSARATIYKTHMTPASAALAAAGFAGAFGLLASVCQRASFYTPDRFGLPNQVWSTMSDVFAVLAVALLVIAPVAWTGLRVRQFRAEQLTDEREGAETAVVRPDRNL